MTQIQLEIDRLILRLKQQAALRDVRFVREYGNEASETPVRGMLAVVSLISAARDKGYFGGLLSSSVRGESFAAKAEIRVYAPQSENGSGLSELVSELLLGLREADEENVITEASASSISFDPDMNAIYRTVEFSLAFCVCEED